jgi:hypothetical protein
MALACSGVRYSGAAYIPVMNACPTCGGGLWARSRIITCPSKVTRTIVDPDAPKPRYVGLLNFGAHTPRSFVPNREAIRRFIRSAHPAPRRSGTPQQNVFPYHSGRQASASTPSASPGSGQGRSRAFQLRPASSDLKRPRLLAA